jgi:hypothetical protein
MTTEATEASALAVPQITFTVEFSQDGLLDLQRRLSDLLGTGPAADVEAAPTESEMAAAAASKARALWDRLGESLRDYLAAAATLDGEFTVDDVVTAMNLGEDGARLVKAYHRNVARSAAVTEPRDVPILESRREGNRTKLRMSEPARSAITALAQERR